MSQATLTRGELVDFLNVLLEPAKQVLAALRESHRANVDACDRLLRSLASARERAAVSLHPISQKEMP